MGRSNELNPHQVTLTPYAVKRLPALRQALQLQAYIEEQGPWLDEVQPDVAKRYDRGLLRAVHNVRRVGREPEADFRAYTVTQKGRFLSAALGIATITYDQIIGHPALPGRRIVATDLDYSLAEQLEFNRNVHERVAETLMHFAEVTRPTLEGLPRTDETMLYLSRPVATIVKGRANPSYGFKAVMEGWDEPTPLQYPLASNAYEMAKGGKPLELYVSTQDVDLLNQARQL